MTGTAKRKGDTAERECAALIHDLIGEPARRKLGAGRMDDQGDIDGVLDTTIQVASRNAKGLLEAVRHKPAACHQQQVNAGTTFGATFIRLNGGTWRVVLTPEQWATLWREATR
jgi:hypothetical protein